MKKIEKDQYKRLNKALYDLEDLLQCMGIREFTLSRDTRNMCIDTGAENVDTELLGEFCTDIERIHAHKFGHTGNSC